MIDDLLGVTLEQLVLRPRDAIPREPADRFEQARSEGVVQILRLQLFRRQLKVACDLRGKLGEKGGRYLGQEALVRNFAYT
jgi:hypothetical protein